MIAKLLLVVAVTSLCMLVPGPDMVLVMRNTFGERRSGGWTALGVLTGNLCHIAYCTLGIALLISCSAGAFNVLRGASAAYLVYLAVQSFRSNGTILTTAGVPTPEPEERLHARPAEQSAQPEGDPLLPRSLHAADHAGYIGWRDRAARCRHVSATFWAVFVQTLHLPVVRVGLPNWTVTIERAFGVVLILFAAQIAMLRR